MVRKGPARPAVGAATREILQDGTDPATARERTCEEFEAVAHVQAAVAIGVGCLNRRAALRLTDLPHGRLCLASIEERAQAFQEDEVLGLGLVEQMILEVVGIHCRGSRVIA